MIDIVACTSKKPSPTFCLKNFSVVQKSDAGTVIQHREKGRVNKFLVSVTI